jgi:hypothetical protein
VDASAEAGEPVEVRAAESQSGESDDAEPVDSSGSEASRDAFADDPEHQNAARVARVMVSDLLLYQKDDIDEGLRQDDFFERNKEALGDMRETYDQRVPEAIRAQKDHLKEAIENFIVKRKKKLGLD